MAKLVFSLPLAFHVLMPITLCPVMLLSVLISRGLPELPASTGAVCWMKRLLLVDTSDSRVSDALDIMPFAYCHEGFPANPG